MDYGIEFDKCQRRRTKGRYMTFCIPAPIFFWQKISVLPSHTQMPESRSYKKLGRNFLFVIKYFECIVICMTDQEGEVAGNNVICRIFV